MQDGSLGAGKRQGEKTEQNRSGEQSTQRDLREKKSSGIDEDSAITIAAYLDLGGADSNNQRGKARLSAAKRKSRTELALGPAEASTGVKVPISFFRIRRGPEGPLFHLKIKTLAD
jgi:hypothetical protein